MAASPHRYRRLIKLFVANPAIGFLARAKKYGDALANCQVLAPANCIEQMQHVIYNTYAEATLPDYDACVEHMQTNAKVFDVSRSQACLNAKTT